MQIYRLQKFHFSSVASDQDCLVRSAGTADQDARQPRRRIGGWLADWQPRRWNKGKYKQQKDINTRKKRGRRTIFGYPWASIRWRQPAKRLRICSSASIRNCNNSWYNTHTHTHTHTQSDTLVNVPAGRNHEGRLGRKNQIVSDGHTCLMDV